MRPNAADGLAEVDCLVALLHILFLGLLLIAQDEKLVPLLLFRRSLRISLLFFPQLLDLELACFFALLFLESPLFQLFWAER